MGCCGKHENCQCHGQGCSCNGHVTRAIPADMELPDVCPACCEPVEDCKCGYLESQKGAIMGEEDDK